MNKTGIDRSDTEEFLIVDALCPKTILAANCQHCRKLITVSKESHDNNFQVWCPAPTCQEHRRAKTHR